MSEDIGQLRVKSVGLMLKPDKVRIDSEGRLTIVDPEILQAILAATPESAIDEAAADTNYAACGANIYRCGTTAPEVEKSNPPV